MPKKGESIFERKDGRFEARYIVGRDENGRAIYKSMYGHSKAEVREKVEAAKEEIYGEAYGEDQRTFREAAKAWLDQARETMASTTLDRYVDTLEREIYPEYGDTPMKDVTEAEMNRFLKIAPEIAAKQGRTLKNSSLQTIKTVLSNVIGYAKGPEGKEKKEGSFEKNPYKELEASEIERICHRAKNYPCPEMLAVLLSLYCGMRTGELCALKSEDVDMLRNEIYIHEIVHRIKNPKKEEEGESKTIVVVEEIKQKKLIRRVNYPDVLSDYIEEFRLEGKTLIRSGEGGLYGPRTLEKRLEKMMEDSNMEGINFERLRKTYLNGKADVEILNHSFQGIRLDRPYAKTLDMNWLTKEMTRDLAPLRMLLGFSIEEMGEMLGVSVGTYRQLENGSKEMTWDQYLAMLFMFQYNMRTSAIVGVLGLYPDSLKEKIRIGDG